MTREVAEHPPKPKLLEIRWVCGLCLRVLHERLEVSWVWESGLEKWEPRTVEGPKCHGLSMLILGEPKVDAHGLRGYGLVIDPLDDMRCPKMKAA